MTEKEKRARVAEAAISWLNTPYAHYQAVKGDGGGVDCGMLLAAVYAEAGVIPPTKIDYYPIDWHLHRSKEEFLNYIKPHAKAEYAAGERVPQVGDILLFKYGRCISHSAIVIEYPLVIHAYMDWHCVCYANMHQDEQMSKRFVKIIDMIGD